MSNQWRSEREETGRGRWAEARPRQPRPGAADLIKTQSLVSKSGEFVPASSNFDSHAQSAFRAPKAAVYECCILWGVTVEKQEQNQRILDQKNGEKPEYEAAPRSAPLNCACGIGGSQSGLDVQRVGMAGLKRRGGIGGRAPQRSRRLRRMRKRLGICRAGTLRLRGHEKVVAIADDDEPAADDCQGVAIVGFLATPSHRYLADAALPQLDVASHVGGPE